jgi:hypothetical protein
MQSTAERNKKILALIEEHTKEALTSRKTAREALIKTGIYTKKGQLRVEFGGKRVSKRKNSEAI